MQTNNFADRSMMTDRVRTNRQNSIVTLSIIGPNKPVDGEMVRVVTVKGQKYEIRDGWRNGKVSIVEIR